MAIYYTESCALVFRWKVFLSFVIIWPWTLCWNKLNGREQTAISTRQTPIVVSDGSSGSQSASVNRWNVFFFNFYNKSGTESLAMADFWHCPLRVGLWNGRTSVRLSVCLSHQSTAACGGFAAEHPAGRRYRSIAGACVQQQRRRGTALSSKCGQCHVDSRGRRLNTDLLQRWCPWK